MAFRISLNKASKAQEGSKSKAEEEAKAREEKNALEKIMADVMDEHGDDGGGILDQADREEVTEPAVFVPTGAKRHFTGRPKSMMSGPGTLASETGAPFARHGGQGGYKAPGHSRFGAPDVREAVMRDGQREDENVFTTVVAKASNLPPAIDPRRVEALFSDFPTLKVTKVERAPPSRPSSPSQRVRPSATMKVTFDKDASARDLNDAMNKLNDKKYLGKGYYLHLDRYLGGRSVSTRQVEEVFGATFQEVEASKGYAPPPDLGGWSKERQREDAMNKRLLVTANAPPDLATLRLIHQTIEAVVEGGMEFEAALMQDPQIQEEERFAWLFDQKHPLNRYYRWRLREVVSSCTGPEVFVRQPDWKGPKDPLPDEFASGLWDLNQPLDESDSEEEEDRPARATLPASDNYAGRNDSGYGAMSPRSRALLIWLLATLPPSNVMYDEIAAFSVFAVDHVSKGLDEVVYLLVTNIFQPFFFSKANPRQRPEGQDGEDDTRRRAQLAQLATNGLRIISDVALTTNRESGMCYKYRMVIGSQLVDRKVFEYLETLPGELSMGRMGETQYRDEINGILKVWEEEHLFDKDVLEHLDNAFNARKRERDQEEQERKIADKRKQKKSSIPAKVSTDEVEEDAGPMDIDHAAVPAISALDGSHDTRVGDGDSHEARTSSNISGPVKPANAAQEQQQHASTPRAEPAEVPGESAIARARRLRPKAEDMFVSDGE